MKRIPSIATLSFLSLVGCATTIEQTRGTPTEVARWCSDPERAVPEFLSFAVPSDSPGECLVLTVGGGAQSAELHGLPCSEVGVAFVAPGIYEDAPFVGNPIAGAVSVEGTTRDFPPAGIEQDYLVEFGDGRSYRVAGNGQPSRRGCIIARSSP